MPPQFELSREIFQRGVDIGDDVGVREWAMFMSLVARRLERIGDNTVDIAERTLFIVTGVFRDFDHGDLAVSSEEASRAD